MITPVRKRGIDGVVEEWHGRGERNRFDHPGKGGRKGERNRLELEVDIKAEMYCS